MNEHRGVLLDEASFTLGDLDLNGLFSLLAHWQRYPATENHQRYERLESAAVAIINKVRLDAELIESLPRLRLVLLAATGTDNVDLDACRAHGITVCNVSDYCTASVAQHVFALILALSTSLMDYARETVTGDWSRARHFSTLSYPIHELEGKAMGLVGYGTLARGVEKLAQAFGMRCLISERPGAQPRPGRLSFEAVLSEADVISLHCPLTPDTKHLINASAMERMKPGAILINTARGAVVDNIALACALRAGQIGGAGIDVLEQEPPAPDHPLLQPGVPNVIVTPHTAWASIEARQRLMDRVTENLAAWLQGRPINVVA